MYVTVSWEHWQRKWMLTSVAVSRPTRQQKLKRKFVWEQVNIWLTCLSKALWLSDEYDDVTNTWTHTRTHTHTHTHTKQVGVHGQFITCKLNTKLNDKLAQDTDSYYCPLINPHPLKRKVMPATQQLPWQQTECNLPVIYHFPTSYTHKPNF